MSRSLIGAVLACVLVGAVAAEAKDPSRTDKAPTTKPTPKAASKNVKGVIAHVDLEAKSIKIEVKDKQQQVSTVEVSTDEKTVFLLDGSAVTLADLRDGMRVTVTPGSGAATRVSARSESKSNSDNKKAQ